VPYRHLEIHMYRHIQKGTTLFKQGYADDAWLLRKGIIQFESIDKDGNKTHQLAIAGDVIGVETLCGQPHSQTATALNDCKLEKFENQGDLDLVSLLAKAYFQQQRRSNDITLLRTGTVSARLKHLLKLLAHRLDQDDVELTRKELPTMKEMALIVDTAPETVCRVLAEFLPVRKSFTRRMMNKSKNELLIAA
jgi:CRP-like cAMP-binding protein